MGQGVLQDLVQAYAWYAVGAGHDAETRALMTDLETRLTRAQVAEAVRRAQEWRAAHPP